MFYTYTTMLLLHGIIKLALNRETALRQAGAFSPADETKLLDFHRANYEPGQNERYIRHLGQGGTYNVDLVYHPQHGYQARKSVRANIPMNELLADKNTQIWDDVKGYQDAHGPSGFARVNEVTPEKLIFQDVAQGPSAASLQPHMARLATAAKAQQQMRQNPALSRFAQRHKETVLMPARARAATPMKDSKLSPDLRNLSTHLRRKYPQVYDHNTAWNVHMTPEGPMSIDISASKRGLLDGATIPKDPRVTQKSNFQFLERAKRLAKFVR